MTDDSIQLEFQTNAENGHVGSHLVSETDRVRVWYLEIKPTERLPVHRHQLDYFWTALSAGKARSYFDDGTVSERDYVLGDTQHFSFEKGESMMHDLANIGDTVLKFTTVEFKNSANSPLPL
ncbi:hypothetical protein [Celeribacter sp.]|uniref:hypothetical protein n=1 Tax=Celeribacter sp. TaxID=1890673 RepID=UPI003A953301